MAERIGPITEPKAFEQLGILVLDGSGSMESPGESNQRKRAGKMKRLIQMIYIMSLLSFALALLITPPSEAQSVSVLIFFDRQVDFDQQFQQTLADLLRKKGEGLKLTLLALGEEKTKEAMERYKVREEEFPIVLVLTADKKRVEKRLLQNRSGDGDNIACDAFYQITGKVVERTNPKDGDVMVYIPAGEFIMGTSDEQIDALLKKFPDWDHSWFDDEKPQRNVYLDGYWIYKYEVTVAQYRKFCNETGRQMPSEPFWGWQDNHPIVNVIYNDAVAYCNWANVQLPTEAQWEKAARGTDGRTWPWGNQWDANKCNNYNTGLKQTTPVGNYPQDASPYGVMDMAGNVLEWCADWYDENYYASASNRNPQGPPSGTYRVLRGGSWGSDNPDLFRAAARDRGNPDNRGNVRGLRCVSSRVPQSR